VITTGAEMQVLVATKPVDFRKQADGLAAIVQAALGADPFSGAIYVGAAAVDRGRLPTEALAADVVMIKHADHLPLYRQAQILARHGIKIERSTLAQ
jgi:transposase